MADIFCISSYYIYLIIVHDISFKHKHVTYAFFIYYLAS